MGPLGELGALFNPGMRHEIEERKSKANRREEEGNARDGDLRIDLASGVAVINIPSKAGGESKSEPRTEDATAAQDDEAIAKPGAKSAAMSSGRGSSSMPARRTSSGTRSSAGRTSSASRGLGESPSTPEKPRNGQVPSSKASRSSR